MKVLIPIAEPHYRSFVTVVDMINRGYPDEQIFAEMKARRGDLASLGGAMVQAVEAMGGFPGTPPDPPPSGDLCAACIGLVHPLDVEWGDIRPIKTAQLSPRFGCNDYWVLKFTVPATFQNDGYTSVAGFDGPENFRQITLSRSPCDFREPDPSGVNGPFSRGDGTSATVTLPAGLSPSALVPGATYFINIRNWSRDLSTPGCNPDQLTDAIIQFHWPK